MWCLYLEDVPLIALTGMSVQFRDGTIQGNACLVQKVTMVLFYHQTKGLSQYILCNIPCIVSEGIID
jgi:hypothetical protein